MERMVLYTIRLVNQATQPVIKLFETVGKLFVLWGDIFFFIGGFFKDPKRFMKFYWPMVVEQMVKLGVNSLPVVLTTALFTGMVLAVQTGSTLESKFKGSSMFIGNIVSLALIRELGPVLTALLITGRVGSAMAAEVGTMKITEQVDALRTLATNPVEYLAAPRFIALVSMMPLLTILANVLGTIGGLIVSKVYLGVTATVYFQGTQASVEFYDFLQGLVKSVFFGMIVCVFALHRGFSTFGGAVGVGRATTGAVVSASITILIVDYFLTQIFALF
jgi:phospholipid/cholesterol/gamma-HCH transport system permease protein